MKIYPYAYRETHCGAGAALWEKLKGFHPVLGACGNVEMVTLKRVRDRGVDKGCSIARRICEVCEAADALMRRQEGGGEEKEREPPVHSWRSGGLGDEDRSLKRDGETEGAE